MRSDGVSTGTWAKIWQECEISYVVGNREVEFVLGPSFTLLADKEGLEQLLLIGARALCELRAQTK